MIGTTQPSNERSAADVGLSGHLLALLASFSGYFRARLELAGLEGKEAAATGIKVVALLVVALLFFAFGYAFLWIGLIALLASCSHLHWGWMILAVGVLHLLGVLGCVWIVGMLWKKPVFPATLEEFRKDQEWLNRQK